MAIKQYKSKGMSLIGLLIALAIIVTSLVYVFGAINFSLSAMAEKKRLYQANFLAQQAMEAIRSIRDSTEWSTDGLGTVAAGSIYHLEQTTPLGWDLVGGEQTKNGFTENVVFTQVKRDSNDNIIEAGGVVDANSKKITVTISWLKQNQTRQIQLVNLFTNWR